MCDEPTNYTAPSLYLSLMLYFVLYSFRVFQIRVFAQIKEAILDIGKSKAFFWIYNRNNTYRHFTRLEPELRTKALIKRNCILKSVF